MSYQKLPPELKQYITNQIRTSDIRYAKRLGIKRRKRSKEDEVGPKTGPKEMDTFFRGRGIDNWSRTSKECRERCLPILFELRDFKILDEEFQYQILNDSVANGLKSLLFTGLLSVAELNLLLFHIVPRFSSLRKISVSAALSKQLRPDFRFAQLVKIAKDIADWDFGRPRLAHFVPLLDANRQNIHTLAIGFGGSDCCLPFLEKITTLPSLTTLTLNLLAGRRTPFDSPASPIDFSKLKRLERLTVDYKSFALNSSALALASLFPKLSSLRLSSIANLSPAPIHLSSSSNTESYTFPSLSHLELTFPTLTSMRSVLEQSSFPNLQSLKLFLNSEDSLAPEEDPWNEYQVHEIAPLISQISESCGPSLRLVIVKAGSPGDERLVEFLKQLIESRDRRDGSAEASRGNIENNPAVTYEVEAEYPRVDEPPHLHPRWQPSQDEGESELVHRREELNDLTEVMRKVHEWTGRRIEAVARENDRNGARELVKGMRELREAMRWMED